MDSMLELLGSGAQTCSVISTNGKTGMILVLQALCSPQVVSELLRHQAVVLKLTCPGVVMLHSLRVCQAEEPLATSMRLHHIMATAVLLAVLHPQALEVRQACGSLHPYRDGLCE